MAIHSVYDNVTGDYLTSIDIEKDVTLVQLRDVHGLEPGAYRLRAASALSPTFTVPVPEVPGVFATKATDAAAYFSGPAFPTGIKAVTYVLDVEFAAVRSGYTPLIAFASSNFVLNISVRDIDSLMQFTGKDSAGTVLWVSSPTAWTLPSLVGTRRKLVVSVSADTDGSNSSLLKAWCDGTEVNSVAGATSSGALNSSRTFTTLNNLLGADYYELSMYGGTHAEGFAGAGGDVAGLTLLHTISGDATAWNAGNGGLVKAGVDLFT